MTKMAQKKEKKRSAILNAAHACFLTNGYIGTGMDDIACHAGVTKQTVYRYFPSKEALFQASLEVRRDARANSFLNELDKRDVREALLGFSLGFLKVHMSEEHLAGIRLLLSEGPSAPEITRIHYATAPRRTHQRLADFLRERFGSAEAPQEASMLVSTLLSMRMQVLVGVCPAPSSEQIAEHARRTVDVFLKLYR